MEKLTLTPAQMSADDLAPMRKAELNDVAIHDVCAVTAYFAYINRIADGLGVDLEPGMNTAPPWKKGGCFGNLRQRKR